MAFDQATRNRLQRFVTESRSLLADEFTRQLQSTYGMNPNTGELAEINTLTGLTPHQQETAQLLRDTLVHYLANAEKGKEKVQKIAALERIVREQAFTVLNRLAALRMSEARGFLTESIAKGYESKGFQLFHRLAGTSLGETGDTYHHYLYSLFDEFSLDLAVLFDRFSVQGRLFPSQTKLLEILSLINHEEINQLWIEDETVGWIYQYFNSIEERRQMRAESQAPRNSRELAVRNQFFTPRYVVEFLTDNTLGRIWYEMTQGNTGLKTSCKYLVRRPNELFLAEQDIATEQLENLDLSQEQLLQQTVYIEYRKLKDPRDIRMLDPACGSMHFGLYAFDLFEAIYSEAWDIEIAQGEEAFIREPSRIALTTEYVDKAELLRHVPRLIIEHNIHGVDIDPRAAQIAGLSLWLRAHNSWQKSGIKPVDRPKIQRSNIVCAEPMPGEKALLQEFTASLKPTVLGQLVEVIFEKMELAGEAGSLLKIEEEIQNAIAEAKQTWQDENKGLMQFADFAKIAKQRGELDFDVSDINDEGFWEQAEQKILDALEEYAEKASTDDIGQKRLFSEDAAKGFAFIELCRKRFDVVLMNPPFGLPVDGLQHWAKKIYPFSYVDIYASMLQRGSQLCPYGYVGAITSRSYLLAKTLEKWRIDFVINHIHGLVDLGSPVMDDAVVESCAAIFTNKNLINDFYTLDLRSKKNKDIELVSQIVSSKDIRYINRDYIKKTLSNRIIHSIPAATAKIFQLHNNLKSGGVTAKQGLKSFDDFRFFRAHWEVELNDKGFGKTWEPITRGGGNDFFWSEYYSVMNWKNEGNEVGERNRITNGQTAQSRQASRYYRIQGGSYTWRASSFRVALLPKGVIIGGKSPVIQSLNIDDSIVISFINSSVFRSLVALRANANQYETGIVEDLPIIDIDMEAQIRLKSIFDTVVNIRLSLSSMDECSPYFSGIHFVNDFLKSKQNYYDLYQEAISITESAITKIDYEVNNILKINSDSFKELCEIADLNNSSKLRNVIPDFCKDFLSFLFGVMFGRWKSCANDQGLIVDFFVNPFKSLPELQPALDLSKGGRGIISVDNNKIQQTADNLVGESFIDGILKDMGLSGLDVYYYNIRYFFTDHLMRYTTSRRYAPIYWPLQTLSGSYTLWLYYHRLNEQTLFSGVNDFIRPRIDLLNEDLATLRNKLSRNKDEEKEFDRLTEFKTELEDFRDELLRIAKFWKPNLNDGVQITAAPLWRLFQHRPWQNKLQETWEQLEAGDYDWAHLAYSIWPARVLRKCHKDRSLAIAHEVENELWHEVEVIKGRSRAPVLEWQPKALSEAELAAYIQSKIQA